MISLFKCLLFCSLLLLLGSNNSNAQEKPVLKNKKNQVLLSFGNGLTFNKFNVKNDGVNPDPIEVPSATTYKYNIMLNYQRRTSYGLLYGIGIGYGNYVHDVIVNYPTFEFLDTMQGAKELSYKRRFTNKLPYWALNLFIGYSLPVTNKKQHPLYLETKMGLTARFYASGGGQEKYVGANIFSNDTLFAGYYVSYIFDQWGSYRNNYPGLLEGYIGIRKQTGWKYMSDVSLGFFGTYLFKMPGTVDFAETEVRSSIYLHGIFQNYVHDYYVNKDATFGIRAGFGLSF